MQVIQEENQADGDQQQTHRTTLAKRRGNNLSNKRQQRCFNRSFFLRFRS